MNDRLTSEHDFFKLQSDFSFGKQNKKYESLSINKYNFITNKNGKIEWDIMYEYYQEQFCGKRIIMITICTILPLQMTRCFELISGNHSWYLLLATLSIILSSILGPIIRKISNPVIIFLYTNICNTALVCSTVIYDLILGECINQTTALVGLYFAALLFPTPLLAFFTAIFCNIAIILMWDCRITRYEAPCLFGEISAIFISELMLFIVHYFIERTTLIKFIDKKRYGIAIEKSETSYDILKKIVVNVFPEEIVTDILNGISSSMFLFHGTVLFIKCESKHNLTQIAAIIDQLLIKIKKGTRIKFVGNVCIVLFGLGNEKYSLMRALNFAVLINKLLPMWKIGICSGEIIGFISDISISFDILGSSVNISSRMMSSFNENKIHLYIDDAEIISNLKKEGYEFDITKKYIKGLGVTDNIYIPKNIPKIDLESQSFNDYTMVKYKYPIISSVVKKSICCLKNFGNFFYYNLGEYEEEFYSESKKFASFKFFFFIRIVLNIILIVYFIIFIRSTDPYFVIQLIISILAIISLTCFQIYLLLYENILQKNFPLKNNIITYEFIYTILGICVCFISYLFTYLSTEYNGTLTIHIYNVFSIAYSIKKYKNKYLFVIISVFFSYLFIYFAVLNFDQPLIKIQNCKVYITYFSMIIDASLFTLTFLITAIIVDYFERHIFLTKKNIEIANKKIESQIEYGEKIWHACIPEFVKSGKPERYFATIICIDIVNFTPHSKLLKPDKILEIITSVFKMIKQVAENYEFTHIKSIGDALLLEKRLLIPIKTNTVSKINFSNKLNKRETLRMVDEIMNQLNLNNITWDIDGVDPVEIRCGISRGIVTAQLTVAPLKISYDYEGNVIDIANELSGGGKKAGNIAWEDDTAFRDILKLYD